VPHVITTLRPQWVSPSSGGHETDGFQFTHCGELGISARIVLYWRDEVSRGCRSECCDLPLTAQVICLSDYVSQAKCGKSVRIWPGCLG
jgi:hypothetical protein